MKPTTPHVKGTDLVTIKKLLAQKGENVLNNFYGQLSLEAADIFRNMLSGIWVPNALATEIMESAAKILFPHAHDDLEQLGAACAEHALTGIYKAFLSLTSVPFLLKHVPMVWNMYHSVGAATVTPREDKKGATLFVDGAPGVRINNLRLVGGFSAQALKMAGAKNVTCKLDTSNPNQWQWTFDWLL